ncbi:hypothetical protein [Klebsiella pneumoniae]|uniref:hypothetical protein n=1 Tax=Klebsiella pneumoniae TaxID=573 RepID=UPI0015E5896A|nr:hypothetical protein [Klebsiella pneumoniae]QLO16974.1 hypothetical protein HV185_19105 [Klebsiella pneumoniae]
MGEISVKTGNNARNGGKNSLNRLIRCVCGKKIGPDPRNFNQRVSLGRNDLLIRTFPMKEEVISWAKECDRIVERHTKTRSNMHVLEAMRDLKNIATASTSNAEAV